MDLFEPRTMLEAVEQMKRARRFLGTTFFGANPVNSVTQHLAEARQHAGLYANLCRNSPGR